MSASITAYLVQALFNVQQVGLSFTFWLLVGLLAVLSRGAGVPGTLRPAVLLSPETNKLMVGQDGEPRRPGSSPLFVPWQTGLAALLVIAVVVVTSLGADEPYRADHDYWAAHTSVTEAPATGTSTQPHTEVGPKFFADLQHAAALNPWEPTYPALEATGLPTVRNRTHPVRPAKRLSLVTWSRPGTCSPKRSRGSRSIPRTS